MKKILFVAVLALAPLVAAGCTCVRNNECRPAAPQAVCQPQPVCNPCVPVVQTYQPPLPTVPGRITYAQPVQVSGANTVQYYTPRPAGAYAPAPYYAPRGYVMVR